MDVVGIRSRSLSSASGHVLLAALDESGDGGSDERGLAEQTYGGVRAAIVDGRLVPGDVLTPSRTLAAQFGISRFTVTEAYALDSPPRPVRNAIRGPASARGARSPPVSALRLD